METTVHITEFDALKSMSKYLHDLLYIDNLYFEAMVNHIYPSAMQLQKASRKNLRTKVTPDFHLTYSKIGGNLGSESKCLKVKNFDISP